MVQAGARIVVVGWRAFADREERRWKDHRRERGSVDRIEKK
jgi:hypothetical protein